MQEEKNMLYSVVVPVFNSAGTLRQLTEKIAEVFAQRKEPFEIIYVDDHSKDSSWEVLKKLKKEFAFLKVFRLDKNNGQLSATTCGINHASAPRIITTDCDLQYNPLDFNKLIECYESGKYKMVFGVAEERQADSYHLLRIRIANFLFNQIVLRSHRKIIYFSGFRILTKDLFFNENGSKIKFNLFHIWELKPQQIGNVMVEHRKDPREKSSYSLAKRIKHFECYLDYAVAYLSGVFLILLIIPLAVLIVMYTLEKQMGLLLLLASFLFLFLVMVRIYFKRKLEKGRQVDYGILESL